MAAWMKLANLVCRKSPNTDLLGKKGINGVNGKEGEHVKPPIMDDELTWPVHNFLYL